MDGTGVLRGGARLLGGLVLALLVAASWLVWTGGVGAAHAPWQVAGALACAVALTVLAPRWLPGPVVIVVAPLAFTVAWAVSARTADDSGLWAVGAIMVLLGSVAATLLLVPLGTLLRGTRPAGSALNRT
ncbi:hypothetical protein GCM10009836_31360 [Pseudonocardia ailaonensis]|uniref:SPW repeat-containing protein n=1 Tax=Pseudonocardia ailaonensis TaxID=367279 RepID=A0ABN2N416_9PSEU